MPDQAIQRSFIDRVLSQAYPLIYAQIHPILRDDIINSAMSGEDVTKKFVGAPEDSAALNYMEWVQVIGVGATLLDVGYQFYKDWRERTKSKVDATKEACETLRQHALATRIQLVDLEVLLREFQRALDKEP
jgi:hypothetical protein